MNRVSVRRSSFVLTGLLLAIIIIIQATSSQASSPMSPPSTGTSPSEFARCKPGSGWVWTNGPSQTEIATQVQQTFNQMGIDVVVVADSLGERDSCGSFRLYEINFSITVMSSQINEADQPKLIKRIYPILMRYGKPNLGDVIITFMPDHNSITIPSPGSALSNDLAITNMVSTLDSEASWQQVVTQDSPPGRYTHGLTYDTYRNVAVLFGGDNTGASRLNDTWEFDGTNWMQVTPLQSPPGRVNIDQALTYDSNRRKVILFGGLTANGYISDTWEYDGTTWEQIITNPSPQRRDSHAMAFDRNRNVTVLFGGYGNSGSRLSDTWEYNGTWTLINTPQTPIGRYHHAMAYDESRNVVVMFGGLDSSNSVLGDTWEYDGITWRKINSPQSPPARHNHSMVYDTARETIILYGGENDSGLLTDTWEYDGTTWRQATTTQSPSPRKEMPMVYDQQRGKVSFFGGGYWNGSLTTFDETWEYTPSSRQVFLPIAMNSYAQSEVFSRNIYVIAYNPLLNNGQYLSDYLNWNNHTTLTQGTVDFFRQISNNKINYNIVYTTIVTDGWPVKIDGFRYTEAEYLAVINGQSQPHNPDAVDYNAIVNSPAFDICGKVNRGEIDEVWIYNGPYFGFYESTLVGPGAYWYNSPPISGPHNCNRLIPIMGPSPERNLDSAIHNFGHRTEATMTQVYGSWQQNRTAHNWERFALVEALSPSYFYSGCGNIHYPPNGTSDYDYGNSSTVLSNCDDFANYPNLGNPTTTAEPVTCSAWGCTQINYLAYWFSHLPANNNCGPDGMANNWWKYFIDPALALSPSSDCP